MIVQVPFLLELAFFSSSHQVFLPHSRRLKFFLLSANGRSRWNAFHFRQNPIMFCLCVCDTNLTSIEEFSLFNLCHNGSRSHFSGSSSFFRSASIDHICNLMAIQSRVVFSLFVSRFRRVSKRECDQNYICRENSPCQCVTTNCRGCEGAHFECLRAFFRLNSV